MDDEGCGIFTTCGNPLVLIKLKLCKSRWVFGSNAMLLASDVTTYGDWLACSGVDVVVVPSIALANIWFVLTFFSRASSLIWQRSLATAVAVVYSSTEQGSDVVIGGYRTFEESKEENVYLSQ